MNYPLEAKVQVLLLAVHALAFVVLAVWCGRRANTERWAGLGVAGAGLLGMSFGILAASTFENVFLESARIAINVLTRDHVYTLLIAAQALGAVLLALAFVESRRTTPTPTESIYGPE